MKSKVTCLICSREYKMITVLHLRKHGITIQQYKEQFPHAELTSPATHLKQCMSATLANADLERRRRQSERMSGEKNPFYGKTHDDETRQAMSANVKAAWARDYDRLSLIRKESARRGQDHHGWKGGKVHGSQKHKARMKALAVYGATCLIPECDFNIVVHNHHILPKGNGGTHDLRNCIILCPNHHAMADAGLLTPEYLQALVDAVLDKQ